MAQQYRPHFWLWWPPLAVLCLVTVAPLLSTHDPRHAYAGRELAKPSAEHWLGNDHLGRDEWSRLVVGGRRSLGSALLATLLATGSGLALASASVAAPSGLRWSVAVLSDALLAVPALLLALVVRTLLGGSFYTLAVAVGVAGIGAYSRVARGALQAALIQPHIEGAKSIGATEWRILTRHVIPAALPTLGGFAAVTFAWSLIYGAALAYLGLGGDVSAPDWGYMIARAQGNLAQAPLLVMLPGSAIAYCVWLAYRFAKAVGQASG
jgi:peptide/nickel transport system permease protein